VKDLLLGLLACLILASAWDRAAGQGADPNSRGPSHVPLPPRPNEIDDPEQLFQQRLGRAEALAQLRSEVRKLLGKDLNDVLKAIRKGDIKIDPNSPEFARLMQQALEQQNAGQAPKLTPEQIEAARRLWQDLFPKDAKLPPITPPSTMPPSTTPPSTGGPDRTPPPTTTPSPANTPPNPPRGEPSERQREIYDWLLRRMEGLEGLGKSVNDSPALREMVRDLSRYTLDAANLPSGQGIDARLAGLGDSLDRNTSWLDKGWSWVRGIELPGAPNVRLPSVNVAGGVPSMRVPNASVPHASAGSVGKVLLWLVVLALLGVVLWKLLRARLAFLGGKSEEEWKLGPWPVRPQAMTTREDLVRAFEYLSLLLLGRQARVWNHIDIAGRLGGNEAVKQAAAMTLAGVYEKARYAPADEPLGADALAAARRDLCLLAGVAGA
jgi:hypothetical protein